MCRVEIAWKSTNLSSKYPVNMKLSLFVLKMSYTNLYFSLLAEINLNFKLYLVAISLHELSTFSPLDVTRLNLHYISIVFLIEYRAVKSPYFYR